MTMTNLIVLSTRSSEQYGGDCQPVYNWNPACYAQLASVNVHLKSRMGYIDETTRCLVRHPGDPSLVSHLSHNSTFQLFNSRIATLHLQSLLYYAHANNEIAPVKNEIVVYQPDETLRLEVRLENETVWLSQEQMITLFGRDRSVICRHIRNAFREREVDEANCLHILQTNRKGRRVRFFA